MFRGGLSSRVTFMRQFQPYLGRVLLVAVLAISAGAAGRALAQDDDVERDQAVGHRQPGATTRRDEGAGRSADCPSGRRPGSQTRAISSRCSWRVGSDPLASERHLTDAQLTKLRLAGRADIKRFVDRLDQIARTYAHLTNDRDEMRSFIRALQDASSEVRIGFFVTDSLFCKTLARMLATDRGRGLAQASIQNDQSDGDQHAKPPGDP